MKKLFLSLVFGTILSSNAYADQVYVISSQPRYVTYNEEQCRDVLVERPASNGNAAGGVLGAIAGAAIGNQIGKGSGKDIATVVGGVVGYQAGRGESYSGGVERRRVCEAVPVTVQRGEIVTFSYKGIKFTQTFDY